MHGLFGLVVSLALIGCGGGGEDEVPKGPLAEVLAEIGGGGEHGSLGVGWTDPPLARRAGFGRRLMADALGPNADTVMEAAPALRRGFGFEPLSARRLVSVGGSYAFGLRLEGVGAPGLRDPLAGSGAQVRHSGGLDLVDVGGYAEVPEPLVRAGVLGLGARDAFGPDLTVLAISETSRAALLGRGDHLIDQPIYRAAADCLGDVVAARMIPDKLLLSTELGVDLVAVGIGRGDEVLCVLGGAAGRARQIGSALRASLTPPAREPRSGEPIANLVRDVDVEVSSHEDVEVVRAEFRPAPGRSPGFLFDAIALGSLPQLINGS